MVETPTLLQAPPSAATKVKPHRFSAEIKARWNRDVEGFYRGFQNLDRTLIVWGKSFLDQPSESAAKTK